MEKVSCLKKSSLVKLPLCDISVALVKLTFPHFYFPSRIQTQSLQTDKCAITVVKHCFCQSSKPTLKILLHIAFKKTLKESN